MGVTCDFHEEDCVLIRFLDYKKEITLIYVDNYKKNRGTLEV